MPISIQAEKENAQNKVISDWVQLLKRDMAQASMSPLGKFSSSFRSSSHLLHIGRDMYDTVPTRE